MDKSDLKIWWVEHHAGDGKEAFYHFGEVLPFNAKRARQNAIATFQVYNDRIVELGISALEFQTCNHKTLIKRFERIFETGEALPQNKAEAIFKRYQYRLFINATP